MLNTKRNTGFIGFALKSNHQSQQPLLFLLTKLFCPLLAKLQVTIRLMGLVVQIQTSSSLLGYGSLNLRPFMPLIKWSDRNDIWPNRQRCLQWGLVITSVDSVPRVVVVPWPDSCVYVTRPSAGHEEQIVCIAEVFDGLPVLMRGAIWKAIGCKVGVHAVEAAC